MDSIKKDKYRTAIVYIVCLLSIPLRIFFRAPMMSVGTFLGQRRYNNSKYIIVVLTLIAADYLNPSYRLYELYSLQQLIVILFTCLACYTTTTSMETDNSKMLSFYINLNGTIVLSVILKLSSLLVGACYFSGFFSYVKYIFFELSLGEGMFICYGFLVTLKSAYLKDEEWYDMKKNIQEKISKPVFQPAYTPLNKNLEKSFPNTTIEMTAPTVMKEINI